MCHDMHTYPASRARHRFLETGHRVGRVSQRCEVDVRVVLAHRFGIVPNKLLNDRGADLRIFHQARGSVPEAVEGKAT